MFGLRSFRLPGPGKLLRADLSDVHGQLLAKGDTDFGLNLMSWMGLNGDSGDSHGFVAFSSATA